MSSIRSRRLTRELHLLSTSPPPGIAAWPEDSNAVTLTSLHAEITGAAGTPYSNGIFRLSICLPAEYPLRPPAVRFVTPIYHPNIDTQGRICLDTLCMPPKGAWTPSLNVATVLASVQLLMAHPNPEDGLMPEVTQLYKRAPVQFAATAREWTTRHAGPRPDATVQLPQPPLPAQAVVQPIPPEDGAHTASRSWSAELQGASASGKGQKRPAAEAVDDVSKESRSDGGGGSAAPAGRIVKSEGMHLGADADAVRRSVTDAVVWVARAKASSPTSSPLASPSHAAVDTVSTAKRLSRLKRRRG